MRLGSVAQRVFLVDRDFHGAAADHGEQVVGDGKQILALGGVGVERRARGEQRTLELQDVDVEGLDRTRSAAEAYEHAERTQAVERSGKGCLADPVVDHIAQLAAGDLLHPGDEILVAVEDGVMAAVRLGERRLLLRADGADHGGAEMVRPLAENEPDAAGGRVHKHVHPPLDLEGAPYQVFHRHALEHHGGGLLVVDIGREFYRAIGRHHPLRGIAAGTADIGDTVAALEFAHAGADLHDLAGGFIAGDERQATRRRVEAHAEVHVDEIDAAGVLLDADLAGARRRHVDLFIGQNLGPTDLVHAYRSNHCSLLVAPT